MAIPSSRSYDLNTAVSAGQTPEGKFDEQAHAELIKPLRERIVHGNDGIVKCHVSRFDIDVYFMSAVITADRVQQIVEEAVEWATTNVDGMFPLRGDKHPAIVKHKETPAKTTTRMSVIGRYTTSTIAYTPSRVEQNTYDKAQAARELYPLALQLTGVDGVLDYAIGSDGVRLDFDTRYISVEVVKSHISRVLKGAKRNGLVRLFWAVMSTMTAGRVSQRNYFPYIGSTDDLEIIFEVTNK